MSRRIFGFSLAELLITLGIIGVISALIIPNLIGAQDMAVSKAKFKKTVSLLSEAGKMSEAQYGVNFANVTYTGNKDTTVEELGNTYASRNLSFYAIFLGTMKSPEFLGWTHEQGRYNKTYYSVPKLANSENISSYLFRLQDGTLVGILTPNGGSYKYNCHVAIGETVNEEWIKAHMGCLGFIDVNGYAKPNKEVSCSDGTETTLSPDKPCAVKKDPAYITDIYPIVFHDSIVEPASNAAAFIMKNL